MLNELRILYAKLGFGRVLKRSLSLDASKVIFIAFNLNCGLHAVSVCKPSARMSNFWMVQILFDFYQISYTSEQKFSFPHTPIDSPEYLTTDCPARPDH